LEDIGHSFLQNFFPGAKEIYSITICFCQSQEAVHQVDTGHSFRHLFPQQPGSPDDRLAIGIDHLALIDYFPKLGIFIGHYHFTGIKDYMLAGTALLNDLLDAGETVSP
jgi:hypothetical protein